MVKRKVNTPTKKMRDIHTMMMDSAFKYQEPFMSQELLSIQRTPTKIIIRNGKYIYEY